METIIKSRWSRDFSNRGAADLDAKYQHPAGHLTAEGAREVLMAHVGVRPSDEEVGKTMAAIGQNAGFTPEQRVGQMEAATRGFARRKESAAEFDDETVQAALAMIEAGLAKLGGQAHIHAGGSQRLDGDPGSGNQGSQMTTVVVTLTVVTPLVDMRTVKAG